MNKVIIFPTDTVYGIGTSIYNKEGIKKIYDIKKRDYNKPIAVLCSSLEQIKSFAIINKDVKKLAEKFWPGSLTIILNTNEKYYNYSKEKTIGVRIPNHKLALKIIDKYGPLKTTSINDSGKAPINDYNKLVDKYNKLVDYIYPNDEEIEKKASTVISILDDKIHVIREGNITKKDIESELKKSF